MPSIEMTLRVRWADSDPAGRINFPRYFDYMEDGEAALMRSCGLSYGLLPAGYGVPRVHTDCTFKKILNYDVPFTMRVTVGRLGNTSIRYEYQFFTEGDRPELAAEGSMTIVVIKDGRPTEIPANWRAALSDRPAPPLAKVERSSVPPDIARRPVVAPSVPAPDNCSVPPCTAVPPA